MSESATASAGEGTATESTGGDNAGGEGIESQVQALRQRLDAMDGNQAGGENAEGQETTAAEETPLGAEDLLDILLGDDESDETGAVQAQTPPAAQTQGEQTPERQAEARAQQVLDQYVEQRVTQALDQRLNPFLDNVETRFRQGDLASLANKYPELATQDGAQAVRDHLAPYVDRYGEGVRTDPGLVEMALRANRAAKAGVEATPASQARDEGAALETGAGVSGADEKSADEQEIEAILSAGGKRSAFFGGT